MPCITGIRFHRLRREEGCKTVSRRTGNRIAVVSRPGLAYAPRSFRDHLSGAAGCWANLVSGPAYRFAKGWLVSRFVYLPAACVVVTLLPLTTGSSQTLDVTPSGKGRPVCVAWLKEMRKLDPRGSPETWLTDIHLPSSLQRIKWIEVSPRSEKASIMITQTNLIALQAHAQLEDVKQRLGKEIDAQISNSSIQIERADVALKPTLGWVGASRLYTIIRYTYLKSPSYGNLGQPVTLHQTSYYDLFNQFIRRPADVQRWFVTVTDIDGISRDPPIDLTKAVFTNGLLIGNGELWFVDATDLQRVGLPNAWTTAPDAYLPRSADPSGSFCSAITR